MSLRDAIAADTNHRPNTCSVCDWIAARNGDDEDDNPAGWDEIMADSALGHAAIHRAMKARGYLLSSKPVEAHRNDGHSPRGA